MDVKTACLAVLYRGAATGAEIRRAFDEGPLSFFFNASFGSIYPALARLCDDGLAESLAVSEPGRPHRKFYRITDAGRANLAEALAHTPAPDRFRSEWVFGLYLADLIAPETLQDRVAHQAARYRKAARMLAQAEGSGVAPTLPHAFTSGFGQAIYTAAADYLERHGETFVRSIGETGRNLPDTQDAAD